MGRGIRTDYLRRRVADFEFQITQVKNVLNDEGLSDRRRVLLAGELSLLERRHADLLDKLNAVENEDDGTGGRLRAEWEQEWDALVQDFEERISRLT
jgi:hypothetical protein